MSFEQRDELSDYLASLNLQHYAPQLHQEDIHCLADLRILTARDLAACGVQCLVVITISVHRLPTWIQ